MVGGWRFHFFFSRSLLIFRWVGFVCCYYVWAAFCLCDRRASALSRIFDICRTERTEWNVEMTKCERERETDDMAEKSRTPEFDAVLLFVIRHSLLLLLYCCLRRQSEYFCCVQFNGKNQLRKTSNDGLHVRGCAHSAKPKWWKIIIIDENRNDDEVRVIFFSPRRRLFLFTFLRWRASFGCVGFFYSVSICGTILSNWKRIEVENIADNFAEFYLH